MNKAALNFADILYRKEKALSSLLPFFYEIILLKLRKTNFTTEIPCIARDKKASRPVCTLRNARRKGTLFSDMLQDNLGIFPL